MKIVYILCIFVALCMFANTTFAGSDEEEKTNVSKVLDALHEAASKAEGERYFSLYTDDAIFLGTDATERWTMEQMKEWAIPYFAEGKGWTYVMEERYIYLSEDQKTAWFDERLMNEKYGECRGSGVLVKVNDEWKVAQYNLTFPVPNSIALEVVEMIKKATQE